MYMLDGDFDWDQANITHIAQHGVKPEEAEQVVANNPITLTVVIRGGELRTVCAGLTNAGRALKVVYTRRSDKIRVVTAHEDRGLRRIL
jgi:uncharacterized DUF497 family protein